MSVDDIINKKSDKKTRKTVEFDLITGQAYAMCLICRLVQKLITNILCLIIVRLFVFTC